MINIFQHDFLAISFWPRICEKVMNKDLNLTLKVDEALPDIECQSEIQKEIFKKQDQKSKTLPISLTSKEILEIRKSYHPTNRWLDKPWLVPKFTEYSAQDVIVLNSYFIKTMTDDANELEVHLKNHDIQKILSVTHRVKGSASVASCNFISSICNSIETFSLFQKNEKNILIMTTLLIETIGDVIESMQRNV